MAANTACWMLVTLENRDIHRTLYRMHQKYDLYVRFGISTIDPEAVPAFYEPKSTCIWEICTTYPTRYLSSDALRQGDARPAGSPFWWFLDSA